MEMVFVYSDGALDLVGQAVDPEEWARTWGARNFPDSIYFFAEVVMPA